MITRRNFLKSAGLGIALLSGCGASGLFAKRRTAPNVLFIAIDDLRPELGTYGKPWIKSPSIDALSSQGIRFNKAYCQVPLCGPSRASLLSGIRPSAERFYDNNDAMANSIPGIVTLPQAFKENGYTTITNGKIFHHPSDTANRSWSETPFDLTNPGHRRMNDPESENYINPTTGNGPFYEIADVPDNAYIDGEVCEKTIEDLRRLKESDKPFFLACGFVRPHLPFYAPKKYWDMYERDTIDLAANRFRPANAPDSLNASLEVHQYHFRNTEYNSEDFHKTARHGYYACVSYVDNLVGRILETLDELELRDNTIVVLWGDHGWLLGEHNLWSKHYLLHDAIRTTLIISVPWLNKNMETDSIVELIDIYPTLCNLAGIDIPEHVQGKSMDSLLKNPESEHKKQAFSRFLTGDTIVTDDYIYTEYKSGDKMLYDLKKDPAENRNVVSEPDYNDVANQLSRNLKEFIERASQKFSEADINKDGHVNLSDFSELSARWQDCSDPAGIDRINFNSQGS
jgi:iduronate 2-sulfatase